MSPPDYEANLHGRISTHEKDVQGARDTMLISYKRHKFAVAATEYGRVRVLEKRHVSGFGRIAIHKRSHPVCDSRYLVAL